MKLFVRKSAVCSVIFVLSLIAIENAYSQKDVEVYRDFEFRNTLHLESLDHFKTSPWEPERKAHVKNLLDWLYAEHPGFIKHAVQYGPVSLYRAPKSDLDYIDQPADAGYRRVRFFDYDPADKYVELTIVHELIHVTDAPQRLANGQEWRTLIEPRIEKILKWRRENNAQKSLVAWGPITDDERAILNEAGLPRFYSAYSPAEALADIAAYMIMRRRHNDYQYNLPADIKAYIESHLLSSNIEPYPAAKHYYNGRLLNRKGQYIEAEKEYQKALELDPQFANAIIGLAAVRWEKYIRNAGNNYGWEAYFSDVISAQKLVSSFDQSRQLEFYYNAVRLAGLTGNQKEALQICETVNEKYPAESRSERAWLAYRICGSAYAQNKRLKEALSEYEKVIELVPFKQAEMARDIGGIRMALAETLDDKWAEHDRTMVDMNTALAEKGDPGSMLRLGKMYVWGTQAPKDYMEAFKWLTMAYKEGETEAAYWLAYVYDTGHDLVLKDSDRALHWARISADAGHARGQYLLGTLLTDNAESDPKALTEAYSLFYISANNPDLHESLKTKAAEQVTRLETKIPPGQLEELKQYLDEQIKK